jgi:hypothetical protein
LGGQPNAHGSTIDVILRFPGQIADAHSELFYNYFRDYDPETGSDTRGTPNCQIMRRIPTIPCALAGGPLTPEGIACRASVTAVMCSTICDKNEEIKQCQN